jgi:hypothetical protein
MTISLYFHASKESLYNAGEKAGLAGDALDMFVYFNEIGIFVDVNPATGEAKIISVDGRPLADLPESA